jgi:hypothetical protein
MPFSKGGRIVGNNKLIMAVFACGAFLLLSGCYTVIHNPNAMFSARDSEWVAADAADNARNGRYDQREADDEFYRYPGVPSSYGSYGGAGYPLGGLGYGTGGYYGSSGYRAPYGAYNGYGYGNSYGYGPYSYGYDPYYTDNRGYYVSPGYELVSTRELDDIRASLANIQSGVTPVDQEALKDQQRRREEEVWSKRVAPQIRKAPTPTRSSSSSVSSPPRSSSSTPASKTTSTKSSVKPKKKRR